MTDKLIQAAEMALEALVNASDASRDGDHAGCRCILYEQIYALRQALDQLPDTTKMIDTGTDRGAWSDVPDATKWVDELRGDEPSMGLIPSEWAGIAEPPNSTTDVVEREWQGLTDEDIIDLQKASWVDKQAFEAVAWMIDEFLEKKNI
jgi:hypothetical protein